MVLIPGAAEFGAAADGRTSVLVGARFCLNLDDDDVAGMLGRGRGTNRTAKARQNSETANMALHMSQSVTPKRIPLWIVQSSQTPCRSWDPPEAPFKPVSVAG